MNLSDTKVVVFDFDGTLVDSMGGFEEIASRLIEEVYGWEREEARQAYLRTSGSPFRDQLEELFPEDPRNDSVSDRFEAEKRESYHEKRYFDDADETISSLRDRGYKTVVSSNNFQELVRQFVAQKQNPSFDLVLGWRPGFAKGTDHFRYIRERFRVEPDQILFVGDSLKDAEWARVSGTRFLGRVGLFPKTAFEELNVRTILSLSDLRSVLCRP